THVINYQCVEDEKIYLHRVGRTGRAGNKGTAVTFVDWEDMPRWALINKALGLDFAEPVETYSSSAHLYTDLDIPEGTKGRLPRDKRVLAGVDAEVLEDLGETGKRVTKRPSASSRGDRQRSGERRSDGRRSEGASGDGEGRRRRTRQPAAETTEAPAAEKKSDDDSRRRRPRNRTRRRNGEVVAREAGAPAQES
ncbi:MAG: ATP-dependent helicase, partial [Arthrobacter sp.]|nr:ATP-dependent helicase [Arthrobacter sp.]